MKRSRIALGLALSIGLTFTAVGGAQQPKAADYGGIDPAVAVAWEEAGAEFVTGEAVPTFRFNGVPQARDFQALPSPSVPFGLDFSQAALTEQHLKAIGALKQIRALSCYQCDITNEAGLAHLEGLPQLQDLSFNHLNVSEAGLNLLAGLKQLRTLQLRGVPVTDRGLEWLARLAQLETLRLPFTRITPGTLKSLVELPRLTKLYLQAVGSDAGDLDLTDAHLVELAKLSRLETLSLRGSNLTDDGLKKLAGLRSLRALDIYGSKVRGRGVGSLSGLRQLRSLEMGATDLSDEALDGLATLTAIESLTLGSPTITDAWLSRLSSLVNLRELAVTNSPISDDGLKALAALKQLRVLQLNRSKITGLGLRWLAPLEHLREVRLGSSLLNDAGLKEVAGLTHLEVVGFYDTQVTDAGVRHLVALKELQSVLLGGDVTDESLKVLATLPHLTHLELAGTITDAGLRSLKDAPQLRELWLPEDDLGGITIAGISDLTAARPSMTIDDRLGQAIRDRFEVDAAIELADPAARLSALERVRSKSKPPGRVDEKILATLVANSPDRSQRIAEVIDRIIAAVPEGSTTGFRLATTLRAVGPLVEKRLLLNRAEQLVNASLRPVTDKEYRGAGLALLGRIHLAQGHADRARQAIEEGMTLTPGAVSRQATALVAALAELETQQGESTAALDHFTTAAALSALTPAQDASLRALYRQAHGSEDGLEDALNRRHRELLPNPVTPTPWVPPAGRSKRVVLFELFTGSGCSPCVAADLAFEALLRRYPADAVAGVAYHQSVPLPDPMVISAAQRLVFHRPTGTPSVLIDGRPLADGGGGLRDAAASTYAGYVANIDRALQEPAAAMVAVNAAGDGDQVSVRATVTGLPATQDGVRLHVLLVERELGYVGENGVRPHAMVVRAMADADGSGLSIKGNGTTTHTFSLSAIRADVAATLASEVATYRKNASARTFAADGHAQTTIDPSRLVVVAFVQDGSKRVLQAAQADVVVVKK